MPGKSEESDQIEDRAWLLNGHKILSHYAHTKVGHRKSPGCAFCSQGVGAVVTDASVDDEGIRVVEDTGGDQEGAAAHTSGDGDGVRPEGELQRKAEWWASQSQV